MGECLPSWTYTYEQSDHSSEVTFETWDRDYPYEGDEPRINVTVVDFASREGDPETIACGGLDFEQVRAVHHVLGRWLQTQS
jgi:hypothetical protein